ncbi:MAG TPA: thermonuclease family protein [Solirubrobacterales bacterium]
MPACALALLAFALGGCEEVGGDDERRDRAAVPGGKRERPASERRESRKRDREPKSSVSRPERAPGIPADAKRTTVVEVTDGDTVELEALGASRIIGVDTPEVYGGAECFGREASEFAKSLLRPGDTVYYRHGVERTDRYGRDLIYLWLRGGTFFNAALLKEGYAVTLTIPPNVEFADLFRRLAAKARAAGRGLWASDTCDGDPDAPAGGSRPRSEPTSAPGGGGGAGGGGGGCEPGYTPCVPRYPPDLDCADIGRPVTVTGRDPHNLDGDGDGRGCE